MGLEELLPAKSYELTQNVFVFKVNKLTGSTLLPHILLAAVGRRKIIPFKQWVQVFCQCICTVCNTAEVSLSATTNNCESSLLGLEKFCCIESAYFYT